MPWGKKQRHPPTHTERERLLLGAASGIYLGVKLELKLILIFLSQHQCLAHVKDPGTVLGLEDLGHVGNRERLHYQKNKRNKLI